MVVFRYYYKHLKRFLNNRQHLWSYCVLQVMTLGFILTLTMLVVLFYLFCEAVGL
jgi:hypothetical protein